MYFVSTETYEASVQINDDQALMDDQKYNMTGCGFVSWMKTRVLRRKRRRCLIVAKQFLNGGTKTSEGKEDGS